MYIYHCAFKVSNSLESKWDKQDDVTQNFTFADLAILSQYFFSSCDISKTVFVMKYDGFYFSIC